MIHERKDLASIECTHCIINVVNGICKVNLDVVRWLGNQVHFVFYIEDHVGCSLHILGGKFGNKQITLYPYLKVPSVVDNIFIVFLYFFCIQSA